MTPEEYQKTKETLKYTIKLNRRRDCEYYNHFKVDAMEAPDTTEFYIFIDLPDDKLEYSPDSPVLHIKDGIDKVNVFKVYDYTFLFEIPMSLFVGLDDYYCLKLINDYAHDASIVTKYSMFKARTIDLCKRNQIYSLRIPKTIYCAPYNHPDYIDEDTIYDAPVLRE